VPLIDVRSPVRPDIGADMAAAGAHHTGAERSDRRVVRHVIGVHRDAVVAANRAAIDQQVAAAMASDVPESYRPESFLRAAIGGG
jgi:hypothetical protein